MIQKWIFVFSRPKNDSHLRVLKEKGVRVEKASDDTKSDFCIQTTQKGLALASR